MKKAMRRIIAAFQWLWFGALSLVSPIWVALDAMNIRGYGKGYDYDLGAERELRIFLGYISLGLWLALLVPTMFFLCRKCYRYKPALISVPLLAFVGLFLIGIVPIGWADFISSFGFR